MKSLFLLSGLIIFLDAHVCSQGIEKKFGIDFTLNEFVTGSGFAPGTEISVKIKEDNKKSLSLGMYYCSDYDKILGITINHEVFLLRKDHNKLEPFLFYNFIYRINKLPQELLQYTEGAMEGSYKSLEHHLGLGVQISFYKQLYMTGELGFGAYFGSIEKPVFNPVLMQLRGGNGMAMKAKIGFGINLL